MRRNRESAAASRKRTKEYIEELEGKVLALESTVQALQAENLALRAHAGEPVPSMSPPPSPTGPPPKRPKEMPATPRVALVALDQQPDSQAGLVPVGTPTRHAETLLVFAQHTDTNSSSHSAPPLFTPAAEMVAVQQ